MKLFTGWVVSAGLVLAATGANAQLLAPYDAGRSPYRAVSDFGGPYAAMPPEASGPRYGYGPSLLPPTEVYTVLRENGFSPLGVPRQRGFVYVIAVLDRGGEDGRLVIDARTGRILRFMPGHRIGDNFHDDLSGAYGPAGPLPPASPVSSGPRPPRSIPHVASRTPVPKPSPLAAAKPATDPQAVQPAPQVAQQPAPQPAQQSAAVQAKPAEAPPPAVTTGSVPAKPAAQIAPTQEMPKVQALD